MESKEATSHPFSGVSSGSFTYSSPPYSVSFGNTSLLNKKIDLSDNNDDNSRSDSKGTASEDEGYASGYDEFEPELNKPVLDETGGEENPAKTQSSPISETIVSGVEKVGMDNEGDEKVAGTDLEGGLGLDDSNEAKGEIVDSVEKFGVNSDEEVVEAGGIVGGEEGNGVLEEVETKGEEKTKSLSVIDKIFDDAKSMPEEDSIVDTIRVEVAAPGVAIVGETEENGDVVNKSVVEEVVTEVAAVEPASRGDVKVTSEGDSVVDSIQVDMVAPGVAVVGEMEENEGEKSEKEEEVSTVVVGETEENGDVVNKPVEEEAVAEVAVVEPEKSEVASRGDVKFTSEGDSIVDSIEVDMVAPGVAVVGAVEKNECEKSENNAVEDEKESKWLDSREIREVGGEVDPTEDSMSDEDTDGMIFGSSEAAKKFIEELERESSVESHARADDSSLERSRDVDGQIVTDSEEEEEGETDDDEGNGKELFDSAALAALLKAATGGGDPNGGSITISSQDGSRLFSVERPAGLGSSLQSLRPAPRSNLNRPSVFSTLTPADGGESSEDSLSEEEKKKLEKLQQIRVKYLRLVHRLGLSPEESVAAQVLYRLALLGGRQNTPSFSLDAAKKTALQLEMEERDDLDFSVNILVLGKSGVGKSATVNSIFGQEKAPMGAFGNGTVSAREIFELVDGVKVRVVDTPGLKGSVVEQGVNRRILTSVKKLTKKNPTDVVLYVDRLDARSRDLNDIPLMKTVTSVLGSSVWRNAIVTLTHSASAPPDGPSGAPLSYEVFVSQRSHIIQQLVGHAMGDLRMMSPSLMNPVSLVENHPSCRKNREGHKILPNGQIWRPQLLLLCYSMKILSEAGSISKPQDQFDHRKLFGFRARSPPLPYMLSSTLQSRAHPKLPSDQGGENGDSDIDLDDFSDSDREEDDEYDQLPPFKPLKKAQITKLSGEQRKAYFEEYDYRVKLLQKKQWKEELRRMRELKKRGSDNIKDNTADYDDEPDSGPAAQIAVPLPDMALPASFDGDNPAYRYRFLEPTSQFLAKPVLDTHGWDHDCGYDGVNLEHTLAIFNRFPAVYTLQITKDKKDFSVSLDSSIAAKHGENVASMAGFDIQSMGKQLAYIFRGETKIKNLKRNNATGGVSFTILGENVVPAFKIEDRVSFGKQYTLVGSAGAARCQQDTAYGANFELQRREGDYPVGQVQPTFSMSVIKWRGDLAVGLNGLFQVAVGRNSKVAVRAGINNKMSGQVTVRTSSCEHLSLALAAVIPAAVSVYRKLFPAAGEKYLVY